MSKSVKNVFCVLLAGALSFVILSAADNYASHIEYIAAEREQNAELLDVLPDGDTFEMIDIADVELPESVDEAYAESGGGYVIRLTVSGYAPGMVILCGIGADGTVKGAECVESRETLGREKTYGESVVGVNVDTAESLSTVAGATKTTKGYNKAIKDALATYEILSGGDGNA